MDCLLSAVELSHHLPEAPRFPRGMKRCIESRDREPKRSASSTSHPAMSISSLLLTQCDVHCDAHGSSPISPDTSPQRSYASSDLTTQPMTPPDLNRAKFDDGAPKTARRICDMMLAAPRPVATRIRCYHASVAQKSYGTEKRFMCPPPIVCTLGGFGPLSVSLAVECDQASSLEQLSQLESHLATFRYLHVGGATKAKACNLRLSVLGQSTSALSSPIAIVSKPSKKSIKSRAPHACIASGSTVSLYTRINSQTVRTNYLLATENSLTVAKSQWSPFTINLVDGPPGTTLHYGSRVTLTDLESGLASEPLEVCRVERGTIVESAAPIAQLQKVALRRPNTQTLLSSTLTSQPSCSTNRLVNRLAFTAPQAKPHGIDDREIWTLVNIAMFEAFLPNPPPAPLDQVRNLKILPSLTLTPTLDLASARLTLRLRDFSVPQIWLGWLGPLPIHQVGVDLAVSLPDPAVAIQQMGWCSPSIHCGPHILAYRFPLLAIDPSGFLFSLGQLIEIQVSHPNPIYAQANYTWL
ncbi:hypothetical protein L0F63_000294, partial [Massospora cicadina]